MESKCSKNVENVYAPLVMVSIGARKRTLAGNTVYKNGMIPVSTHLCFHLTTPLRVIKAELFLEKQRASYSLFVCCSTFFNNADSLQPFYV
jgi:hypothetical protein